MIRTYPDILDSMGKQLLNSDLMLVEQTMWFFANIIADNEPVMTMVRN
jgi:hypothetical protein